MCSLCTEADEVTFLLPGLEAAQTVPRVWTPPNLEEDNDGADEHAEALEKISHHVYKGCSHAGVGLLSSPFWQEN